MTKEELASILELHAKWLRCEEGGKRADLSGAYLSGAKDGGAGCFIGPGITFKSYVEEVVPALCVAGGRTLDDVANPKVWNCHSWENCPMAEAFGVHDPAKVPPLYRREVDLFVTLFDARQISLGKVNPKYADADAASCSAPVAPGSEAPK